MHHEHVVYLHSKQSSSLDNVFETLATTLPLKVYAHTINVRVSRYPTIAVHAAKVLTLSEGLSHVSHVQRHIRNIAKNRFFLDRNVEKLGRFSPR